jgi:Spy/CpxP family protein refolding chaperone
VGDLAQVAAIAKICDEAKQRHSRKHEDLRNQGVDFLTAEGKSTMLRAAAQIGIDEANRAFIVLNESQQKRAAEISLQLGGVTALQYGDLASKLRLTDKQRAKIDATFDDFEQQTRTAVATIRRDPPRLRKEISRLNRARRDAVETILTDEQRTQYKSLKGEPSPAGESDN